MEQKKLTKEDLRKVFLRSLTIMCSWNYERQMHMGFMCGMSPVLDKLYADDEEYNFIKENLELLQTVFIVSGLEVEENQRANEEKLGVKIEQAEGEKCERCWMYSKTVGEDKENPTICHKCSEALK